MGVEKAPTSVGIIGVSGTNCAPPLVSLGRVVHLIGVPEGNYAPLLVSLDEIVPQGHDKGKQRATSGPPGCSLETTCL